MEVWVRLGANLKVDEELFKKDPEEAAIQAIDGGLFELDGSGYIPAEFTPEKDYDIDFDSTE